MSREDVASKLDNIAAQIGAELGGGTPPAEPPAVPPAGAADGAQPGMGADPGAGAAPPEPDVDPDEARARDQGWVDLQEWTDQGKDPALWAGHKRFLKDGQKRDQTRELREELQETKKGIGQMLSHFEAMTKQQQARHKAELQQTLAQAKSDLDVDKVVETQKQISDIEQHEKAQAQPPQPSGTEHAVIAAFRAKNPALDRGSDDFNEAFNTIMEAQANQRFAQAPTGLSDQGIQQILDDAYRATKEMLPDQAPRQPRKPRKAPPTGNPSRGSGSDDPLSGLDAEARDMHKFILKKSGERAAKKFLELHKENDNG